MVIVAAISLLKEKLKLQWSRILESNCFFKKQVANLFYSHICSASQDNKATVFKYCLSVLLELLEYHIIFGINFLYVSLS